MRKELKILLSFFLFFCFSLSARAEVNLLVTPIKYELKLNKWERVTKTVSLTNIRENSLYFTTWKTNVTSDWISWKPLFVEKWNPNQELASWIDIKTNSFTIWWLSDYLVSFDINVPNNAVPWWHYWAVYFDYDANLNGQILGAGNALSVNANYAILILVHVNWNIDEGWGGGWTVVGWWWAWPWWIDFERWENESAKEKELNAAPEDEENNYYKEPSYKIDKCPLWDFSDSNHDWKCFEEIKLETLREFIKKYQSKNKSSNNNIETSINDNNTRNNNEQIISIENNDLDLSSAKDIEKDNSNLDFFDKDIDDENNSDVKFVTPFWNDWNTHLKPIWKIIFEDENWNIIERIWIQNIIDENWKVIWQEIIDYLPINWEESNVLPDTYREFEYIWKWFPYYHVWDDWIVSIKHISPQDYFWHTIEDNIAPWYKKHKKLEWKKIKAITELEYSKTDWEIVKFDSERDFYIEYEVECKKINIYFVALILILLLLLILLIYIIKRLFSINKKLDNIEQGKKTTRTIKTKK